MSLPTFPYEHPLTLEEAINLIITAIAMEEAGLSHIINTQGELLQYVLGTGVLPPPDMTIDDLLKVNAMIQTTLDKVVQTQSILKGSISKLIKATTTTGPTGPDGGDGLTLQPHYSDAIVMATWDSDFFPKTMPAGVYLSEPGTPLVAPDNGMFLVSTDNLMVNPETLLQQPLLTSITVNNVAILTAYAGYMMPIPVRAGDEIVCTFSISPIAVGGMVLETDTEIQPVIPSLSSVISQVIFIPYFPM